MPRVGGVLLLGLFLTYAAIWGSTYVWTSMALQGFSPGALVFARLAIAAGLLFCMFGQVRRSARVARERPAEALRLGLVVYGGPFLLIAVAQREVSAGLTGVLVATMPLWVAAMAPLVDPGERFDRFQAGGLIAGWIGVSLVVQADLASNVPEVLASLAIIVASASFAFGGFRLTRDLIDVPIVARAAIALGAAALITAPLGVVELSQSKPHPQAVAGLVVTAAVCTALGSVMQIWLTERLGAGRAALAAYLAPGFSLGFAAALLGEPITPAAVAGLTLITGGVALASGRRDRSRGSRVGRGTNRPCDLGSRTDCSQVPPRSKIGRTAELGARPTALQTHPRSATLNSSPASNHEFPAPALRKLLPGGHGRSTFGIAHTIPYAVRGAGYVLEVHDGRRLVDLNNNFTALVHGHAHPSIVREVGLAAADGASYGLPNLTELSHAKRLLDRLPQLDQVRYTNSGTEAVMTALRVARAHTGRDACIFVDATYHGTADHALVPGGARASRGVPRAVLHDVAVVPINDADALIRTVKRQPDRFAAIVLDLMPNRAGLIPLSRQFVAAAERLRDEHGVLLVIDEVVSFRQHRNGLSAEYGATPDLVTLGKLIGGGHPVGALAGTSAVMSELNPLRPDGLEHGGTFTANPVTMSAGLVALDLLDDEAIRRLNALGDRARAGLAAGVNQLGWEVRGAGSLFRLHPPAEADATPQLHSALWWEALARDVLLVPNGLAALSTPMDEHVIDTIVDRLVEAVHAMPQPSRPHAALPGT